MRNVALALAIGTSTVAAACCGVGMAGKPVVFTGQTNIVVWDAARGVEHFVRDARFETKGTSLGFIAPTPGIPTLSAVDVEAFDTLARLAPPEPVPFWSKSADAATTGTTGNVQVIQVQDVGGYRATVLKAADGKALGAWLKTNGYASPGFLPRWSERYVRRGWTFTAFKVIGSQTGPIRMSFRAERPFNPYYVPAENGGEGAAQLKLYYVSAGREVPRIGGQAAWVKPKWTVDLPEEAVGQFANQLKLAPGDLPRNAQVTLYEDGEFGRPNLDDLYFVPDTTPRNAGFAGGAAVVALALALRRRRNARSAQPS